MNDFEKKKELVRKLKPIDDALFEKLAESPEVCEEILRVILQDNALKVLRVIPQDSIKNLQGRSVRLDALCILGNGKHCNIEVQKSDNDNHLKRVRYNASCITANITETGEHFEHVPEVYVVYISKFDLFHKGKTIYHIEPVIVETGDVIDNGLHEVFVNTKVNDGSDIAELMQCFLQENIESTKFPKLSERVGYFKHDEGGLSVMCELVEDYAKERVEETKKETAIELLKLGNLSISDIARVSKLTVAEVEKLKADM